jgi:hypothetical protein
MELEQTDNQLIEELVSLIEDGKKQLAYAANATITLTYWHTYQHNGIGK